MSDKQQVYYKEGYKAGHAEGFASGVSWGRNEERREHDELKAQTAALVIQIRKARSWMENNPSLQPILDAFDALTNGGGDAKQLAAHDTQTDTVIAVASALITNLYDKCLNEAYHMSNDEQTLMHSLLVLGKIPHIMDYTPGDPE